jgi:hypothetical protein
MMMSEKYRTRDGNGYFEFRFVAVNSGYDIDVLHSSSYNLKELKGIVPLKTQSGYRLDIAPCPSVEEARKEAEKWAEEVWRELQQRSSLSSVSSRKSLTMKFTQQAYRDIENTVGTKRAETGGILLGLRDDYIVTKFIFDHKGSTSRCGYDPDVAFINGRIKEEWDKNGLELLGFIHSHPPGVTRLSGDWGNGYGDIGYLKAIFRAIPALDQFLVPIVFSTADTRSREMQIRPYIAFRGAEENYQEAEVKIISSAVR